MSSSPIHRGDVSSPPIRDVNNNHYLSKILKIALAAIGTIASYALLPPTGAAIASFILIAATIFSFFKSKPSTTPSSSAPSPAIIVTPPVSTAHSTTVFVPVPVSPASTPSPRLPASWYSRYTSYLPSSWGFERPASRVPVGTGAATPSAPTRSVRITSIPARDSRITIGQHHWEQMGSPTYNAWASMGTPSFAEWQRRPSPSAGRDAVRVSESSATTRTPVGTGAPTSPPIPSAPPVRGSTPASFTPPPPPPLVLPDSRITMPSNEWENLGSPSFNAWVAMGRPPSFAAHQRETTPPAPLSRAAVRTPTSPPSRASFAPVPPSAPPAPAPFGRDIAINPTRLTAMPPSGGPPPPTAPSSAPTLTGTRIPAGDRVRRR